MLKKFTNIEKFALICASLFLVMIITVFVLDSTGVWKGVSDIFPFFLGLLTVSSAYLFRKSISKMMLVFFFVCGGLISLVSLIEQILVLLEI